MEEAETTKLDFREIERIAAQQAKDKAKTGAWTADLAAFMCAIFIIIIILGIEGVRIEISALVAILGLSMGWVAGWRQGRRLYKVYYDEELRSLGVEPKEIVKTTVEEEIEEQVRKALRKRWEE
ncbi:hypothetical protein ACFLWR_00445 [Chloroflexota bacterium]